MVRFVTRIKHHIHNHGRHPAALGQDDLQAVIQLGPLELREFGNTGFPEFREFASVDTCIRNRVLRERFANQDMLAPAQPFLCRCLEIGCSCRLYILQHLFIVRGVAEIGLVGSEDIGYTTESSDAFHPFDEVREIISLDPCEFVLCRAFLHQPVYLIQENLLDLLPVFPGFHVGVGDKFTCNFTGRLVSDHRTGNLVLVNHPLVKSGILAVAQ